MPKLRNQTPPKLVVGFVLINDTRRILVDELSVNPKQIPLIKAAVRRWSMADARDLANQACNLDDGQAVRLLVEAASSPS